MTRILIVYQSKPDIVTGLKRGLQNAGVEVIEFLADQHHPWVDKYIFHAINKWAHNFRVLKKGKFLFTSNAYNHWNYLNTTLVNFFKLHKPDFVLFIHGIHFSPETVTQITCPKIGWLVDPVQDPQRLLLFSNNLDWYFSYSKLAINILDQLGVSNVSYLSHSVDHQAFRHIPSRNKTIDVSFVGKHSIHREKYILAALEITNKVSIYGSRWFAPAVKKLALMRSIKGRECYGPNLNQLYNSSKVVLSIIARPENVLEVQSGINMRPYEILASGSLLFSDKYDELHPELINNKNLILFNNLDEFKSSLSRILSDDYEFNQIASEGRKFIQNRFSYDEMVKTILEKFEQI
jgi:hypothetical protein